MKYKIKHPKPKTKGFNNINPIPENIRNVNRPKNNINKAIRYQKHIKTYQKLDKL